MKFQVLTPIRHDGEDYAEGDEIELAEKEARQLVDVGAVEALESADPAKAETANKSGKATA
jgi:hypothetical protein